MKPRLRVAVCGHHRRELEEILREGAYDDVEVVRLPTRSGHPPLDEEEVAALVGPAPQGPLHVLGGHCVLRHHRLESLGGGDRDGAGG